MAEDRDSDGRRRLPNRRWGFSEEISHVWAPATDQQQTERMLLTVNRFADGTPGEVFINYVPGMGVRKVADRVTNLGHDVATLISIARQYGAPMEVLRQAVGRREVNFMGEMRLMPHTIVGTVLDFMDNEGRQPMVVLDPPAESEETSPLVQPGRALDERAHVAGNLDQE